MTDLFMPLIWMILFILAGGIGLIFLVALIDKLVKYFTLLFRPAQFQRGELIQKKMFKTKDAYELRWFGEINKKGKYIIIGIHDNGGTRKDFEAMNHWFFKNNDEYSVVSFDQRSIGENEREKEKNLGSLISDLKEIIFDINDKFPEQKIILAGEGIGAAAALTCMDVDGVYKVVSSSLKMIDGYRKPSSMRFAMIMGWIFSSKKEIAILGEGADLTSDENYIKKFDANHMDKPTWALREYYQSKKMLSVGMKRLKNSIDKKAIILQPAKSVYYNPKKFSKVFSSMDTKQFDMVIFKDSKHLLFNEKNKTEVFEKIVELTK